MIKKAKYGDKEIIKLDEFSITKGEEPIIFKITIEEVSPNVTKSDNESNWTPSLLSTFNSLAKNPSKKSQINPNETNKANFSRSPITPKTTAIHPKNRFVRVRKLGTKLKSFTFLN